MPLNASNERAAPDESGAGPMVAGKVAILAMLVFAVGASFVSWIYYARLQQRPLALWGSRAAELMLRAPAARAFRLAPADGAAERSGVGVGRQFIIAGEPFVATGERDISRAPGFSHIRQSLIHDRSFAWDDPSSERASRWEYAIEFDDRGETAAVAFAFDTGRAALAGTDRTVSVQPVAAAIESFLREQFPAEAQAPAAQ